MVKGALGQGEWSPALFGFAPACVGLTPATGRNGLCSFWCSLFCLLLVFLWACGVKLQPRGSSTVLGVPPLPKLDKVPVIQRSPVMQKEPIMSDPKDSEFAAISQLLSSGALNPPMLDPSARPHPLIRHTASLLRSRSRKD